MEENKKLSEEIIQVLSENCKPTGLVMMGTQFMFKEGKYDDLVEYFQEQLDCAPHKTQEYLGQNVDLISRIINAKIS